MDYTCYIIIGFPITHEEVNELRELAEENLELEDYIINFSDDDNYYFGFIENHIDGDDLPRKFALMPTAITAEFYHWAEKLFPERKLERYWGIQTLC